MLVLINLLIVSGLRTICFMCVRTHAWQIQLFILLLQCNNQEAFFDE